jgi:hypothetical protein
MKKLFAFLVFFFPASLTSCSNPSHWVSCQELQLASDPKIEKIELANDSIITFDHNLGKYDADKQVIEGVTIMGWHDTASLAQVQRIEIIEASGDNSRSLIQTIVLIYAVLGGIAAIALVIWAGSRL